MPPLLSLHERQERAAVEARGLAHSGQGEEGRHDVHEAAGAMDHGPFGQPARGAHDERDAGELVVEPARVEQRAVLAEGLAVVSHDGDDRPLGQVRGGKRREDPGEDAVRVREPLAVRDLRARDQRRELGSPAPLAVEPVHAQVPEAVHALGAERLSRGPPLPRVEQEALEEPRRRALRQLPTRGDRLAVEGLRVLEDRGDQVLLAPLPALLAVRVVRRDGVQEQEEGRVLRPRSLPGREERLGPGVVERHGVGREALRVAALGGEPAARGVRGRVEAAGLKRLRERRDAEDERARAERAADAGVRGLEAR